MQVGDPEEEKKKEDKLVKWRKQKRENEQKLKALTQTFHKGSFTNQKRRGGAESGSGPQARYKDAVDDKVAQVVQAKQK